jgi:hypothetical protein
MVHFLCVAGAVVSTLALGGNVIVEQALCHLEEELVTL